MFMDRNINYLERFYLELVTLQENREWHPCVSGHQRQLPYQFQSAAQELQSLLSKQPAIAIAGSSTIVINRENFICSEDNSTYISGKGSKVLC